MDGCEQRLNSIRLLLFKKTVDMVEQIIDFNSPISTFFAHVCFPFPLIEILRYLR